MQLYWTKPENNDRCRGWSGDPIRGCVTGLVLAVLLAAPLSAQTDPSGDLGNKVAESAPVKFDELRYSPPEMPSETTNALEAGPPSIPDVMDFPPTRVARLTAISVDAKTGDGTGATTIASIDGTGPISGGYSNSPISWWTASLNAAGKNGERTQKYSSASRHPLAVQDDQSARPPAHNAPHRSVLSAPELDFEDPVPLPQPSGEPELVLPPRLHMVDQEQMQNSEAWGREQFWKQFASEPQGGAHGNRSMSTTLRNGFWFAGLDVMFVEPIFQSNNAFATFDSATGSASATHADYNFDPAWKGYLGFETSAGPGIKLSWLNYDQFSDQATFVATATEMASTQVDLGTPGNQISLATSAAGDRLNSWQRIKLDSVDVLLYKDQQNPVSRVRGNIGLRYVSLTHLLCTELLGGGGGFTSLRNVNDWEGLGPKLGVEYFRPIGHTRLEFQSGMAGSLMFGRRDQFLTQAGTIQFSQIGKIEPLAILDLYLGVQWNRKLSRCRTVFLRTALESQYWAGGDSAIETGSDFGFYGFTAGFGITR